MPPLSELMIQLGPMSLTATKRGAIPVSSMSPLTNVDFMAAQVGRLHLCLTYVNLYLVST
jgi:hypothetical protein